MANIEKGKQESFGSPSQIGFSSNVTGVPGCILLVTKDRDHLLPIIKYCPSDDMEKTDTASLVSISIEDSPKIVSGDLNVVDPKTWKILSQFIRELRPMLLRYHRGEIFMVEDLERFIQEVRTFLNQLSKEDL